MGEMASATLNKQTLGIQEAYKTCMDLYGNSSMENTTKSIVDNILGVLCPPFFDSIMCWPPTKENTTAVHKCPSYILGFDTTQEATRKCMENGTWYKNELSTFWTNYSACIMGDKIQLSVPINLNTNNVTYFEKYIPIIKIISRTGYTISLLALIIAFTIMFKIKKLHCPRNKLHMHLFASFIFKALIADLKDLSFSYGVGLPSDIKEIDGETFFLEDEKTRNWKCKLVTSLFEFFITANYSWILMEGLYLYNLIFRSMFADTTRNITHYIILGWGMPLLVTSAWVITRIFIANTFCWTTHTDPQMTFLIIRIPTAISIVVNLILFVRIAVVIYSKLQAPIYEEARRYQKWARSTLVLAELLGIHYALFIGLTSTKNEIVELVWLIIDQSFASFQGFLVAILYCFLNSEVLTELKPHLHAFLTYIATNKCLKYFFPCRRRYLRSAVGRTSVCTTMSCNSLYNNGINLHINNRTIWEVLPRNKPSNNQDKVKAHSYRAKIKSWHETPSRWNSRCSASGCSTKQCSFSSNGSIPNEKTYLEQHNKSKSDSHLLGENICMLTRNET